MTKKTTKTKPDLNERSLVGSRIKAFSVPVTGGGMLSAKDLHGKTTVLYFYPKDNTSGCTTEGLDFKKHHKSFRALGCEIFGISREDLKSHDKFKSKYEFPFDLIADVEETLCRQFDVIVMKSMYGRKYEGIERSTFIIDSDGVIEKEWRKVSVPDHVTEVLNYIKNR